MAQLFSKALLNDAFQSARQKILKDINEYQEDYLLNVSFEDLIAHLVAEHTCDPPILYEDKIYIYDSRELTKKSYGRTVRYGFYYIFAIPFSGEEDLLYYRSRNARIRVPEAFVTGKELRLRYQRGDNNPEVVKRLFKQDLDLIKEHLNWTTNDVAQWNKDLEPFIRNALQSRKDQLIKDKGLVESLGFPIRKRNDAPLTYIAPVSRKKITVKRPTAVKAPFKAEPELSGEIYDEILGILRNMVLVMERSPRAFRNMDEEDLRTHFLVQLNGKYKGQATGETFNYTGKTDILIQVDDRNIFIAECKIWSGPKGLTSTVDQLLGYLSWRDTKAAILVFSRNKDFTNVLHSIPSVIERHPNFKRNVPHHAETEFKFVLHSNADKNRELIVTLLAFDLPK